MILWTLPGWRIVKTTTSTPTSDSPISQRRSSCDVEWVASGATRVKGSSKAVMASTNAMPCFAKFAAAFRSSHSKRTFGIYRNDYSSARHDPEPFRVFGVGVGPNGTLGEAGPPAQAVRITATPRPLDAFSSSHSQAGRRRFDPGRPLSKKAPTRRGFFRRRERRSTTSGRGFRVDRVRLRSASPRERGSEGPQKGAAVMSDEREVGSRDEKIFDAAVVGLTGMNRIGDNEL